MREAARARGSRARALLLALLVAGTLVVGSRASVGASSARVTVDLFGDSLTYQALPYLMSDLDTATTTMTATKVFPGAAVCDALPAIRRFTSATAPEVAVLEYLGNDFTRCIAGVAPGAALVARYSSDLETAIRALRAVGVQQVVVDQGPTLEDPGTTTLAIRAAFQQVVASFHSAEVVYAQGADQSVETPSGGFTPTLPCLPIEVQAAECASGAQISVRSADGVHFCWSSVGVTSGSTRPLTGYCSGAYRYALGLAATIWGLVPSTRPPEMPLVSSLSTSQGSARGGTQLVARGWNLAGVRRLVFELPRSGGRFFSVTYIVTRSQAGTVTAVTPDFRRALHLRSGTVFVSAQTASSESPWLALTPVEFAFSSLRHE